MMKWLWALIAMFAFAAAWQAETPGMLGLWLLVGIVAIVASFLGFLSARVDSVASAQMHRETALLATVKGGANRSGAPRSRGDAGAAAFTGSVAYGSTLGDGPHRQEGLEHGGSGDYGVSDGGGSDGGGGDGGGGGGGD